MTELPAWITVLTTLYRIDSTINLGWLFLWLSSVQSFSCVRLFATPWTAARQASLSFTNSWSLLKLMSIQLVIPSNHLIFYRPLLLLPSIFPSIRVFANESVLDIRWPKYWSFSPSNKYSGLISLRMDRLDLLAVQGTLKIFSNTTVQKRFSHGKGQDTMQCFFLFIFLIGG